MKTFLRAAALAEAGTGVTLLVYPLMVIQLLFGAEISGAGVIISRIAGIALLGLGIACWPGKTSFQPAYGMLAYSTLAMLYLICVGVRGASVGLMLWPGVVAHALIVILLVGAWLKERKMAVS